MVKDLCYKSTDPCITEYGYNKWDQILPTIVEAKDGSL